MTRADAKRRRRDLARARDADRLARALELAERYSVAIDHGLGIAATAAIAALPPGPARAVEATRWVRLAARQGLDRVATIHRPDMTDAEHDATIELHVALAEARGES
jgi:hypothetical protein